MARASAALALVAAAAAGLLLVSGGAGTDPRTPVGLPGLPAPFLGTAVVGQGRVTAAVDAYGDVVDLRPAPAGPAWLAVPAARQAAGTVAPGMAIVPRLRLADGRALPFWRADAVSQRYRSGTNVLLTTARFGRVRASVTYAAGDGGLACLTAVQIGAAGPGKAGETIEGAQPRQHASGARNRVARGARVRLSAGTEANARLDCDSPGAQTAIAAAGRSSRRWLANSTPLASTAPPWAAAIYRRSLLVLRALTDDRTGAVAAGARDGWAYVWPRDAATAALALRAAGHIGEARRGARFLRGLDLGAAARFRGDGAPVPGRAAQGDAAGWRAVASGAERSEATASRSERGHAFSWRGRSDYQEKAPGEYLGNAIAATAALAPAPRRAATGEIAKAFASSKGLERIADDRASGIDSAAAWAVRPFALRDLYAAARASLRRLLAGSGPFGILPSADWPGRDPWTAPTAASAWAFAALSHWDANGNRDALARSDRHAALHLLADLRRAATPLGTLPERLDARTGTPRSTTPLAWSHAFAILALRELWPPGG